jgi:hypothetical protein
LKYRVWTLVEALQATMTKPTTQSKNFLNDPNSGFSKLKQLENREIEKSRIRKKELKKSYLKMIKLMELYMTLD